MLNVFTDGSSSRKRGSLGSAFVISNEKFEYRGRNAFGFLDSTGRNGIAELLAVYFFLVHCIENEINNEKIVIYSDAQYVVNELTIWFQAQLAKNFYNTKNKYIIIMILYLLWQLKETQNLDIKFKWVKGHQKEITSQIIAGNHLADNLAVSIHADNKGLTDISILEKEIEEDVKQYNVLEKIKEYYVYGGKTNK